MQTMPKTEAIKVRRDGWRLHVTLDRPEVRNAMNFRMLNELLEVFERIGEDRSVRLVILRGSGGHFCAGGDVKDMAARLRADGRASDINPLSHGNAWSVYFKDPEENTVEVFCDSPFHVAQPQIKPWDLDSNEEEMRRQTEEAFAGEAEFKPIEEYYAEHRRRFGD